MKEYLTDWRIITVVCAAAAAFIATAAWQWRIHIIGWFGRRQDVDHSERLKNVSSEWKATGHSDFAVPPGIRANPDKFRTMQAEFPLMIEECRTVKSISGADMVERRLRRATLADAIEHNDHRRQWLIEHPEKVLVDDPRLKEKPTKPIGQ
jgi:hypothetical protein